jgi:hypothetical protein
MWRPAAASPTPTTGSDDEALRSRPDHIPIRRRLARSAWSVTAGVLVLLMLGSLAVLMVSSAPLWVWAAPGAPGKNESPQDPTAEGYPSVASE